MAEFDRTQDKISATIDTIKDLEFRLRELSVLLYGDEIGTMQVAPVLQAAVGLIGGSGLGTVLDLIFPAFLAFLVGILVTATYLARGVHMVRRFLSKQMITGALTTRRVWREKLTLYWWITYTGALQALGCASAMAIGGQLAVVDPIFLFLFCLTLQVFVAWSIKCEFISYDSIKDYYLPKRCEKSYQEIRDTERSLKLSLMNSYDRLRLGRVKESWLSSQVERVFHSGLTGSGSSYIHNIFFGED